MKINFFLLLFLCVACKSNPSENIIPVNKNNCKLSEVKRYDNNNKLKYHALYEYDNANHILDVLIQYYKDGMLESKFNNTYEYSNNGKISKQRSFSMFTNSSSNIEYTYSYDGDKLVRKSATGNYYSKDFKYNSDGRLSEIKYFDASTRTVGLTKSYIYDSKKRLTSEITTYSDGTKSIRNYNYDINNNLIRLDDSINNTFYTWEYTFSEYKNPEFLPYYKLNELTQEEFFISENYQSTLKYTSNQNTTFLTYKVLKSNSQNYPEEVIVLETNEKVLFHYLDCN